MNRDIREVSEVIDSIKEQGSMNDQQYITIMNKLKKIYDQNNEIIRPIIEEQRRQRLLIPENNDYREYGCFYFLFCNTYITGMGAIHADQPRESNIAMSGCCGLTLLYNTFFCIPSYFRA